MITFLLLLWIPIILFFNYLDYKTTKGGGKPDYVKYFITRCMAAVLHGVPMLYFIGDGRVDYSDFVQQLLIWIPIAGYEVCSFWLIYPEVRNFWADKPFLYYDTLEHDSGIVDRFFAWTGKDFHAFIKFISLVLLILFAIVIYGHR